MAEPGAGTEAEGEPVTFGEVFDAVTPRLAPGVSKAGLLASLRNATRTGGFAPGRTVPDISMPVVTDLSGRGVHPAVTKALAGGAAGLGDIADALGEHERQRALEPPAAVSEEAAALAGMYRDMLAAGIPAASVERILGAMLATYGAMDQAGGGKQP